MSRRDDLELLLAVVDHGSFSAAGRAVGQTPSAVGKRIAQLEMRLGATLLHRSTRKMSLTGAGRHYVEEAREIAARLAALEEDIAAGAASLHGRIRMTAPIAFGRQHVAPAVLAFMAQNTGIEVELLLTDRKLDLIDESVDLAVRTGALADSGLIARRLAPYRRFICAAPTYLASHVMPATPHQLADHRCLKLVHERHPADWGLAGAAAPGLRLGPGLRCNALDVLHAACMDGEGIACLPAFLCDGAIKSGDLRPLLENHAKTAPGGIAILRPDAVALPRRVRSLIEFLVDHFRHHCVWH